MDDLKRIKISIAGTAPMLMHNGMLADPQNKFSKEIKVFTDKRKKTDEDREAIAKNEYLGSCYWSEATGWSLPGDMLEAMLIGGARHRKLGKAFEAAVFSDEDSFPLIFPDSDKTPEQLYAIDKYRDFRRVVNPGSGSSVMRCRPLIHDWKVDFEINLIQGAKVDVASVKEAIDTASVLVGLGDWRPKFGRFEVLGFEEI